MAVSLDLTGKVALVTGASSGIGAQFARCLAAHGAKVVVAARRQQKLESLVQEITDNGGIAAAVALDVTDGESVAAAFDKAEQIYGLPDIIANNAGVADARPFTAIDDDAYDRVMDTNIRGVFLVAREAAKRLMAANKPGSIINTASILALGAGPLQVTYAGSKGAVLQMTRSMALELWPHGIRVNAIAPGYFKTEINQDFFNSDASKKYISRTPPGRLGELEELEGVMMLLSSDASRFMTGTIIPVDGGHSVRLV